MGESSHPLSHNIQLCELCLYVSSCMCECGCVCVKVGANVRRCDRVEVNYKYCMVNIPCTILLCDMFIVCFMFTTYEHKIYYYMIFVNYAKVCYIYCYLPHLVRCVICVLYVYCMCVLCVQERTGAPTHSSGVRPYTVCPRTRDVLCYIPTLNRYWPC